MTRNRYFEGVVSGPEPHGAAFLAGRRIDVRVSDEDPFRKIVMFGEYAELTPPVENVWPGKRQPFLYISVEDLRERGVNLDSLSWAPTPGYRPLNDRE
jgi:hypothetical protein